MIRKISIFLLFVGFVFSYNVFDPTGFKYYIPFQIENQNTQDLTDFQVKLNIDTKSLIDQGYLKSDCSDIRFVDPKNFYELPYWIESGCDTDNTTIWIKVDSLPANNTKEFWLVFGNSNAVSKSNGDEVFEFFDDFSVYNPSKYFSNSNLISWNISLGKGSLVSSGSAEEYVMFINKTFDNLNYVFEFKQLNNPGNNRYVGPVIYYTSAESGEGIAGLDSGKDIYVYNISLSTPTNNWVYIDYSEPLYPAILKFYYDAATKQIVIQKEDGNNKYQYSSHYSPYNSRILFGYTIRYPATVSFDWWRVRKYAPIDPMVIINISKIKSLDIIDEENYFYKFPITINNPNNEILKDFQVDFVLNTQKLISLGLMNPDCSDLRVTNQIGIKVPYWIETGTCNTTNTTVWIKTPVLYPGENKYYVYFGNPNAKSESNGSAVFEFFDDFDGTSLDASKWKTAPSVVTTLNNSMLIWYHTVDNSQAIRSTQTFNNSFELFGKIKYENISSNAIYFGLASDSDDRLTDISGSIGIINSIYYNSGELWVSGSEYNFFTPTDDWLYVRIIKTNNEVKAIVNGEEYVVPYNDTLSRYIHISVKNTNVHGYADWIFVKKYAPQDPTVEVNLSEIESTTPLFYYVKFIISNPTDQNLTNIQVPIYLNETNFNFDLADYTGLTIRIYDKRVLNPYEDIKNGWNYKGIPYWIEYFKPKEKKGLIWIKINLSANENKTIYIYFSREEPIRFDVYNPGNTTLTEFQVRLPNGISLDPKRKYKIYLENDPSQLLPWWSKDNITWIKVSEIKPGDNYLIIKEDDNGLPSNGSAVFEFFDDFDGDHIDTSKWQSTNDVTVMNSVLYISTDYNDIISEQQFAPYSIIGFKTRVRNNYYNTVLFAVNSSTGYGPGFLIMNSGFYRIAYKYVDSNDWSAENDSLNTQKGWRIFELYWLPLNSYLMFDTNRRYVNDINTYQNRSGYIGLGAYNSGAEFDYVYVRKYSNPEPYVYVATNTDDGKKVFEFFDDFDKPYLNWIRGDASYGPIQYIIRNGILTTWSSSGWQTMYSPKQWSSDDKIVVEIKDRRDYDYNWHKAYITDRDGDGEDFRFGVNGADTIQLYGSWSNEKGNDTYPNQNFKWYIHQIIKDGNHYVMNWLDASNRTLLNWYSADTTTYRDDLVIRQWMWYTDPPAEWDWVKVYKYLDNPPKVKLDESEVFMIANNNTILKNTTIKIYYPSGTSNLVFEGKTDEDGLLYVPIQLDPGYYDIEADIGNETIKREGFLIDPKGIKNPIIQRVEESISS